MVLKFYNSIKKVLKAESQKVLRTNTAKNTVISPDFLVWKFAERHSFRIVSGDSPGNCAFPQNFHTSKLGEITIFYAVNGAS